MSTDVRPELSKKNEYWIEKHRYYELKHFCLQYPIWEEAYNSLDGLSKSPNKMLEFAKSNSISDPTVKCALAKEKYLNKMQLVLHTLYDAADKDNVLGDYIFKSVTTGASYSHLRTEYQIPYSRDVFYRHYRKFFWLLNKVKD